MECVSEGKKEEKGVGRSHGGGKERLCGTGDTQGKDQEGAEMTGVGGSSL